MKTFRGLYERKDYANALLELQKHKEDLGQGSWHYNMGTLKAQTQNLAEARFHFLKAKESGQLSGSTADNLRFVEKKLELERLEAPLTGIDLLIRSALWSKQGVYTGLSLLILVFALVHLRKKWNDKLAGLYAVLIALPLGLSWWVGSWPRSIVKDPQMVLDGPSTIFRETTELPAGVLIISEEGEGGWRRIIYPSRFRGWIRSEGLISMEQE